MIWMMRGAAGAGAGAGAAERLSFDYRVVMDVQFIMIMTIFE